MNSSRYLHSWFSFHRGERLPVAGAQSDSGGGESTPRTYGDCSGTELVADLHASLPSGDETRELRSIQFIRYHFTEDPIENRNR